MHQVHLPGPEGGEGLHGRDHLLRRGAGQGPQGHPLRLLGHIQKPAEEKPRSKSSHRPLGKFDLKQFTKSFHVNVHDLGRDTS